MMEPQVEQFWALEGAEKVPGDLASAPQRLKPYCRGSAYGTDKSVPLTFCDFSAVSSKCCVWMGHPKGLGGGGTGTLFPTHPPSAAYGWGTRKVFP
jgi:hypothetical protein